MNDRYLYRAKRKNWRDLPKEMWWVEGYYAFIDNHHYIYTGNLCNGGLYVVAERFEIDIATLCACTGLKDKNGKLIWENDIVWDSEERKFYKIIFCQEDMCYYAQDSDGYKHTFESCYGSSIEVESNIFDNPELLEV